MNQGELDLTDDESAPGRSPPLRVPIPSGHEPVTTFFVFVDLPKHVEFRVPSVPLLPEGTVIDFNLTIRSLKDVRKTIPVQGPHVLQRSVLTYGGKRPGLVQFLEWKAIKSR